MKTFLLRAIRWSWRTDTGTPPAARRQLAQTVVEKALSLGASLAGIAEGKALRTLACNGPQAVQWPPDARAAIVLALAHPPSDLDLDRWDGEPGGTPGNRRLIQMASSLVRWLKRRHGIEARTMPYQIDRGGIFVKDAAVLAGIGTIGRNNLVVTPTFGPRIRLRAILVNTRLEPTGPLADFAPCDACPAPCRNACPQDAFRSRSYDRRCCLCQMARDERVAVQGFASGIQYCRACELACPVGREKVTCALL